MGYKVKLQKISRPTNKSFFVSIPVVLVESMELEKGEEFDWILEDKNNIVLQRVKQKKLRKLPK
jgi:antitoxin component of MazEF toxin-antitoxin module